ARQADRPHPLRLPRPRFLYHPRDHPHLHSFPTRRSSDLDTRRHPFHVAIENWQHDRNIGTVVRTANAFAAREVHIIGKRRWNRRDRKSTRLNSSHRTISYAVFCLKTKKKLRNHPPRR